MASSYTTNKAIEKPGYNDYINSWNVPVNSDMDIVDACFAGTYSIALTNSNVTLTQANCQVMRVRLTGALSANVTIFFPSGISGFFVVQNATSNAYTVTLASVGGGTSVLSGQSQSTAIFTDGTNVFYADDTRLQLTAGTGISISSGTSPTISNTGVLSFNTRTGAVSLTSGDVTGALGYTPPTPTGIGASGTWGINISGNAATVTNGVYNTGGTYNINITGNSASVTNGVYNNGGTYGINISGNAATAGTVSGGYVSAVYAGSGISVNANQGAITISSTLAGGTVTSVATGTGLTGGTITTSGTISLVTTFGAVGTYAILRYVGTGTANYNAGTTYAGSNLRWAYMYLGGQSTPAGGMGTAGDGAAVSGTWQAMNGLHLQGSSGCCNGLSGGGLFVRIA